jgi:signal transduction histidine kinase
LHKQNLSGEQLDSLAILNRELLSRAGKSARLSPLDRSDREAELSDWMWERDWKCADDWAVSLLSAGVSSAELDAWETQFGTESLESIVGWAVGTLTLEETASAISEATRRIGDIVERVKKYSHMDQSPLGSFDVREGIEATLKMLAHKMRPIEIAWDWPSEIPQLYGYEGELNQVWTNLLDNAADALSKTPNPRIDICAHTEGDTLVVEIVDNGPGLPEAARERLFEPFFTTKPVGKGTGLGLAISHRVVAARHGGDLSVKSQPGETRFRLAFPLDRNTE